MVRYRESILLCYPHFLITLQHFRIKSRDQCVVCGADPGAGSPQRQAVQRGQGPGQCRGERGGPRARQVRPGQEQRARSHQVSGVDIVWVGSMLLDTLKVGILVFAFRGTRSNLFLRLLVIYKDISNTIKDHKKVVWDSGSYDQQLAVIDSR